MDLFQGDQLREFVLQQLAQNFVARRLLIELIAEDSSQGFVFAEILQAVVELQRPTLSPYALYKFLEQLLREVFCLF